MLDYESDSSAEGAGPSDAFRTNKIAVVNKRPRVDESSGAGTSILVSAAPDVLAEVSCEFNTSTYTNYLTISCSLGSNESSYVDISSASKVAWLNLSVFFRVTYNSANGYSNECQHWLRRYVEACLRAR
jgi:hypothetical protein